MGVCIALAVVIVGVIGMYYVISLIDPIPPDQIFISAVKMFCLLGTLCGVALLITWLIKPEEQQTFDPPV